MTRLFHVLVLSVVAGLLLAMLALPAVGVIGLSAKDGADSFLALPANLTQPPLPQPSRIVDASGREIAVLRGEQDREVVPLDAVPAVMRQALIDIEDARFYEHAGLDYRGLVRAYLSNREAGEVTQGGSTLTQQYVKNVLVLDAANPEERREATARTVERKLQEARYALYLEDHLTKDEILERYLNIAYFGDGAYGVQAASKHYFGVDVGKLTLPQAALLAGLVKNPTAYDPKLHPEAARERRDLVLDRMRELGHVSAAELADAKASKIDTDRTRRRADSCEVSYAPFFCAHVRETLLADKDFGATDADRRHLLFEGGLTIKTTIDPIAQDAAQRSVEQVVPVGNRVAASLAMVEPGTGRVLALAVNRRYGPTADGLPPETSTDREHAKEIYPVDTDSFSPGSTFKVFTLAAALERGMPLSTTYLSPTCYRSKVFHNPEPGGCYGNADPSEAGYFSMTTATWGSVNTYYIQLAEQVGILNVAEMARRLGVSSCRVAEHRKISACSGVDGVGRVDGAVTLGSNEVSTLDLATAYATLAARGRRCHPRTILSITHRVGSTDRDVAFAAGPPCEQVLDQAIADRVSAVLQGVVNHGTASGNAQIGRPAAGKTGTAQGFSTASFAGYIPQLAAAVTLADPRGPTRYPLRNVLGSRVVFGGGFPARIWAYTMRQTIEGHRLAVVPMPTPDATRPQPPKKRVPEVARLARQVAETLLAREGFRYRIEPTLLPFGPPGTVLGTNPPAGAEITLDTEVVVYVIAGLSEAIGPPDDRRPPDAPRDRRRDRRRDD